MHRPGKNYTYTNNFPYDPMIGNVPPPAAYLWSALSLIEEETVRGAVTGDALDALVDPPGIGPEELAACRREIRLQTEQLSRVVREDIRPALARAGIPILDHAELTKKQAAHLREYFVGAVFNYPTFAEAYKIAALDAWNRCRA